jgi:hypothetical protein
LNEQQAGNAPFLFAQKHWQDSNLLYLPIDKHSYQMTKYHCPNGIIQKRD